MELRDVVKRLKAQQGIHRIHEETGIQNMREVFGIIRKLGDSRYRIWYDEGIEPGQRDQPGIQRE